MTIRVQRSVIHVARLVGLSFPQELVAVVLEGITFGMGPSSLLDPYSLMNLGIYTSLVFFTTIIVAYAAADAALYGAG